jgi:hypothetical protein
MYRHARHREKTRLDGVFVETVRQRRIKFEHHLDLTAALHNLSEGVGGNGLRPWSGTPASREARLSFRHNTVLSLPPVEGIEGRRG